MKSQPRTWHRDANAGVITPDSIDRLYQLNALGVVTPEVFEKFLNDPTAVWITKELELARSSAYLSKNPQERAVILRDIILVTHSFYDLQHLEETWEETRDVHPTTRSVVGLALFSSYHEEAGQEQKI